jgi:histidyl-tRNA synthetase
MDASLSEVDMEPIQAVKGMNDILPDEIGWWHRVEKSARELFETFGFHEIRTPIVEKTELFARSIGESTDIVEKEMYTFPDSKDRWLTLRPEATASTVRAFIQNNLQADPLARKFYSIGAMFRHERPQKGRYRQFHQINAEAFGIENPMLDAEIMFMLKLLLEGLGLPGVVLHINSLGCGECRNTYRESLKEFLGRRVEALCPDCKRRMHVNPLRAFDCKVEGCKAVMKDAPVLLDFLCAGCADHFGRLRKHMEDLKVFYVVDPHMVRGLDYYSRTTFEVITDRLGAQNAVGGGGRYDGLMRDLGGPDLPGIGFALGMERLILLLRQERESGRRSADAFVAALGEGAREAGFLLAQEMRALGLETEMAYESSSLKSQMRRADKLGSRVVLILGEEEMRKGEVQVRDMASKTQQVVPLSGAARDVRRLFPEKG